MEVSCQATLSDALAQVLSLLQEDARMEAELVTPHSFESPPFTVSGPEQMEEAACPSSSP